MPINHDITAHGGENFGNKDYDHLKAQGHSDSEINSFISSLDSSQVSNKYKSGIPSSGGGSSNPWSPKKRNEAQQSLARERAQTYAANQDKELSDQLNPDGTKKNQYATTNDKVAKYGEGLAGFAAWYNAEGKQKSLDNEAEYRANNPKSGLNKLDWNDVQVSENGLLMWDSTKPINGLDTAVMKEFGIKGGDQIFDPASYKSVNADSTTDGRLDAHYFAQGLAMPLRTNSQSYINEHNAQMARNEIKANASSDKLLDASSLFKPGYREGYHGADDKGDEFVGGMHYENPHQAIHESKAQGDIKQGITNYIADGGYAGDALKYIDGSYKDTLTSPEDIKWYNGLVGQAQAFDWSRTNAAASRSAGGTYDVWAGGLAANQDPDSPLYRTANMNAASGAGTSPASNANDNWLNFSGQKVNDQMFDQQAANQNANSQFALSGVNPFATRRVKEKNNPYNIQGGQFIL